jgi:iron complex transport system ATP-binding protein
MSGLSLRDLCVDVPGRDAPAMLNLDIRPGQIWGILGPNGAGKTTLLHTLAGLRKPRSGQVLLNGEDLARMRRRRVAQQLAVIFQERQDSFPASVLETALIGRHPFLRPWDVETAEDVQLARQALVEMELSELQPRLVGSLSGGERQRLAIAVALCQQPQIWLADEPGNHLDLRHQVQVMGMLRRQASQGRAVVLCVHDINLAAQYCDYALLLYPDGRACWGESGQMLVCEVLESLYRQPLQLLEQHGERMFIPRRALTHV